EDRHRRAHLREGEVEIAHEPRKERGQHEMEEMRRPVAETHEGDHGGVVPEGCGRGCSGGHHEFYQVGCIRMVSNTYTQRRFPMRRFVRYVLGASLVAVFRATS